ncbi:MarR family winged helix-turn-helix transcriptional regulator [Tahibacter amnicola]|uniref:MarR family winged helix-turn-helix transcriptional regulator n=1 Tax=Tahibacter amnicola TaxID=2976241 RepID=A0ABY6BGA5_9GAMM|nr:MarR family winged helix-turn-helix transcriptional regulator [Tahibacter amnicola]UXI66897.1 MarR family winged helix-turn-helix transcriptional regulator [Tahibacter amnicola]
MKKPTPRLSNTATKDRAPARKSATVASRNGKGAPARESEKELARARAIAAQSLAEQDLGMMVKQMNHLMRVTMENRLKAEGIAMSFPHGATLCLLLSFPGLSGADLARATMVTPQTINQILASLERDGMIERHKDAVHGRILRSYLTPLGVSQFVRASEVADQVLAEIQDGLSERELAQLQNLLGRCLGNLQRMNGVTDDDAKWAYSADDR